MDYHIIKKFCQSKTAYSIAFIWGLSEATIFFIVPDFFFMFIAIFAPRRGILLALVTIGGSLLGGFLMYQLTLINPQALNDFLIQIPLISQKMISEVHGSLAHDGLKAVFWAPLKGIPYKIYAVQSALLNLDLFQFLMITIPGRLERLLITAGIAAGIGFVFRKNIAEHSRIWIAGYLMFWSVYYVFYALNIQAKF